MIKHSSYRGQSSIEMESEKIKLIIIPELGANIASLTYKPSSKEWMASTGRREVHPFVYGGEYETAAMSGWDECFPTIIACPYPFEGAYKDQMLPDHGELWSIPWQTEIDGDVLVCKVNGRALPYTFVRRMFFTDGNTLRMEYAVTNDGYEPLSVFWTAHPLFLMTEHTQIRLPESIKEMLCVDGGNALTEGKSYRWPEGEKGLLPHPLDRSISPSLGDSRKFYVDNPMEVSWCGLQEMDTKEYLTMEWDAKTLPYFGVWINEGRYNEATICALEPCNGFYDVLTEAARQDKLLRIESGATEMWHLDVRLGRGE